MDHILVLHRFGIGSRAPTMRSQGWKPLFYPFLPALAALFLHCSPMVTLTSLPALESSTYWSWAVLWKKKKMLFPKFLLVKCFVHYCIVIAFSSESASAAGILNWGLVLHCEGGRSRNLRIRTRNCKLQWIDATGFVGWQIGASCRSDKFLSADMSPKTKNVGDISSQQILLWIILWACSRLLICRPVGRRSADISTDMSPTYYVWRQNSSIVNSPYEVT